MSHEDAANEVRKWWATNPDFDLSQEEGKHIFKILDWLEIEGWMEYQQVWADYHTKLLRHVWRVEFESGGDSISVPDVEQAIMRKYEN